MLVWLGFFQMRVNLPFLSVLTSAQPKIAGFMSLLL